MALELPPAFQAVPIPWESCPSFTVSSAGLTFSHHLHGVKWFETILQSACPPDSFPAIISSTELTAGFLISDPKLPPRTLLTSIPPASPQLILAAKYANFAMGWQFIPTSYRQQITLVCSRSHAEAINLNNTENYSPNQFLLSGLVHPSPVQSVAS